MKKKGALGLGLLLLLAGCHRHAPADPEPLVIDPETSTSARQIITNSIDMKLTLIPAGEFLMGSLDTDPGARADEKPQHRVRITRPYYLGVYEVTQEEYARVMGKSGSFFSPTGAGKNADEHHRRNLGAPGVCGRSSVCTRRS